MGRIRRVATVSACWTLAGCATIISGTTQDIGVTSVPPGAIVTADPGGMRVTTPAKITLHRKEAPYHLTFTLDGYQPYSVMISAETNGWIFGNLIIGGLIGILIDSSSGAMNVLSPEAIHANLVRAGIEPQSSAGDTLYVFAGGGVLLGVVALE
jgi:hypothetical protein